MAPTTVHETEAGYDPAYWIHRWLDRLADTEKSGYGYNVEKSRSMIAYNWLWAAQLHQTDHLGLTDEQVALVVTCVVEYPDAWTKRHGTKT